MYFVELQKRLIAAARQRIQAGLATERRLAKLSGISQPHMHNVLSGIRSVTFDSADKILHGLGLTIPDLLGQTSGALATAARNVPVLRAPIGPGWDASFVIYGGHFPVAAELVKQIGDPVLARLGPDLALPGIFMAGDLVLLDQNPLLQDALRTTGYWVIADGGGLRVCHLRIEKARIFIAGERDASHPDGWHVLETRGHRPEELLKARIVWMARDIMPGPDTPQAPRGQSSPS